jgi:hypothetical protein
LNLALLASLAKSWFGCYYNMALFTIQAVDPSVAADKLTHVILDHPALHRHPKVPAWLLRYPRGDDAARIRGGVFRSMVHQIAAIGASRAKHEPTKPFVWTKSANAGQRRPRPCTICLCRCTRIANEFRTSSN